MPVQRFRSVADTPSPPARRPGDAALYRAIARVWETGRRLRPPRRFPSGVYRHESAESMARQRGEWDRAYFTGIRDAGNGR